MEEEGLDVVQMMGAHRRPWEFSSCSVVQMRDQGEKAPSWSGTASVGIPSSKESQTQSTQSTVKKLLRYTDTTQENS